MNARECGYILFLLLLLFLATFVIISLFGLAFLVHQTGGNSLAWMFGEWVVVAVIWWVCAAPVAIFRRFFAVLRGETDGWEGY